MTGGMEQDSGMEQDYRMEQDCRIEQDNGMEQCICFWSRLVPDSPLFEL